MNALVWLSGLWQGRDQGWSGLQIFQSNLATVAMMNVLGVVSIHAQPVVAPQETFLCLVDPIMA